MHPEARAFLTYCLSLFRKYFKGKALDVGSGDINGNNKDLFSDCEYIGCDIYAGKNVDIVSKCHELPFDDEKFDIVLSSECFEHDMYYEQSIMKIMKMLKQNGLFILTCASTGRPEHGTRRTSPWDSLTSYSDNIEWTDYYKNLTEDDIRKIPNFIETFKYHRFYYNPHSHDLYFVGIKGTSEIENIPDYVIASNALPYGFDWQRYLELNLDVKQVCHKEDQAISHYLTNGYRENRKY